MTLALIAHDKKKEALIEFATAECILALITTATGE